MQPLSATISIEKANNNDIEKYIIPAFTHTFAIEKQTPEFSHEVDQISKKRLFFNVRERQLTNRRHAILDGFLDNIAKELNLSDHESVYYGEAYNANGIGNNVRLPIIVKATNREIHFGYLNANHDLYCNIKHFYLTDNSDERLDVPVYDLVATM